MSNEHTDPTRTDASDTRRSNTESERDDVERDGTPDLYAAISHLHRRLVLTRLLNADQPLTVADLADYVATRDRSFPSSVSSTDEQYQRMAVGLRNTHLPTLDALGFINYDRQLVTANELTQQADKYIHMAAQDEHVRLAGREE